MRAWLRHSLLVAAVCVAIGVIALLVAAGSGYLTDWVALAAFAIPGGLAVFIGVASDPDSPGINVPQGRYTWRAIGQPRLDPETEAGLRRQDDALYTGGVIAIALGIAMYFLFR